MLLYLRLHRHFNCIFFSLIRMIEYLNMKDPKRPFLLIKVYFPCPKHKRHAPRSIQQS